MRGDEFARQLAGVDDPAATASEFSRLAQNRWEAETVRRLLGRYKLRDAQEHLGEVCRRTTGQWGLRMDDFRHAFPDFPALLGARHVDKPVLEFDRSMFLPSLLRFFPRSTVCKELERFRLEHYREDDPRPVGLVFNRRGVDGGLLVMTGCPPEPAEGASVFAASTKSLGPVWMGAFIAWLGRLSWLPSKPIL